jgi:hypothetical protein
VLPSSTFVFRLRNPIQRTQKHRQLRVNQIHVRQTENELTIDDNAFVQDAVNNVEEG